MSSIREVQRKIYGGYHGPPLLPHGEDLEALQDKRRKLKRKRRPLSGKEAAATAAAGGTPRLPAIPAVAITTTGAQLTPLQSNPQQQQQLGELFPASDIPAGFPPELVFRALAAYSTIRTLSLKLRISPFTPVVFLRALHLPVPTRLLGHVHVALLRLLIPHLQQHYHWGAAVPTATSNLRRFPWLPHSKKRKLDGLRWTLRAGDDLEYLDLFTWPAFLDDVAHLTADQLYWSATGPPLDELNRNIDDPKDNPEVWKNLDISKVPDDWSDPKEKTQVLPRLPSLSVLYLNEHAVDDDSDEEEEEVVHHHKKDEDEDFDLADVVVEEIVEEPTRKRKRRRTRKSGSSSRSNTPPQTKTKTEAASSAPQPVAAQTASAAMKEAVLQETTTCPISAPPTLTISSKSVAPPSSPSLPTQEDTRTPLSLPVGSNAEAVTSVSNRSLLQQMSSNYWMQQQLQAQLTATATSTSPIPTQQPQPLPSTGQNSLVQRSLPTVSNKPVVAWQPRRSANPTATLLEAYMYGSPKNDSKETVGSVKSVEDDDADKEGKKPFVESTDCVQSEPALVWAHFEALRELRSGKAYHQLSVEHKLNLLEYIIDEVLSLEIIADDMTYRYNSKEQFDHPYGDLPKEDELEELENDDQCAVCFGEGDLICCDGCPSSYHQQCMGLLPGEELPDGKWYCPECSLVDPAKFGPLREGSKSSVDWFRLRDVCRAQKHLMSLTDSSHENPTEAMSEEKEYLVIHGFVFSRSKSESDARAQPGESPSAPKPLSQPDLSAFLAKVGAEDRGRWPLAQIPTSDFASPSCPIYLSENSTFDPNFISNKYRLVSPLLAPKRLNFRQLKTVEDACSQMGTFHISEVLSRSMHSDALLIEKQKSLNPLFLEYSIASDFARDIHHKLLKALLFNPSRYVWVTEAFIPLLSKATSVESVSRALVALVDAAHPRAFKEEWYESPSHRTGPTKEGRKKPTKVVLCGDSTASLEVSRRTWQCMQPGNVVCALSKRLTSLDAWIRSVKPDLVGSAIVPKNRRKRDNQGVRQALKVRGTVLYDTQKFKRINSPKQLVEQSTQEVDEEDEEGYHFRARQEKTEDATPASVEPIVHIEKHIEKEQEKLVDFILDVPSENWIGEPNWPVAGRRLFEPVGELPKQDIRRLARRAGSVKSRFILYSQAYEVGQASCYHIWRKQMLSCNSFEDMLLGMRSLANFLDLDAVRVATTAARKAAKKASEASRIYCCCTDISSGEDHYLVLGKSDTSGTWEPSRTVDIKTWIPYQSQKIAEIKLKRKEELKKLSADRKAQAAQKAASSVLTPQVQTTPATALPRTGATSAVAQIIQRHNQEVLRLFWLYPNSLGPEFLRSRTHIRSKTTAALYKIFKNTGGHFDVKAAQNFLINHEKTFLEHQQKMHPAVLRKLNELYPPAEVGRNEKQPMQYQTPSSGSFSAGKFTPTAPAAPSGMPLQPALPPQGTYRRSSSGDNPNGNFNSRSGPSLASGHIIQGHNPGVWHRNMVHNGNPDVGKGNLKGVSLQANESSSRQSANQNYSDQSPNFPQSDNRKHEMSRSSQRSERSSGRAFPHQNLVAPHKMTRPANVDPRVWNLYLANQKMLDSQKNSPHGNVYEGQQLSRSHQTTSQMQMVPDYGPSQQSTLARNQSARQSNHGVQALPVQSSQNNGANRMQSAFPYGQSSQTQTTGSQYPMQQQQQQQFSQHSHFQGNFQVHPASSNGGRSYHMGQSSGQMTPGSMNGMKFGSMQQGLQTPDYRQASAPHTSTWGVSSGQFHTLGQSRTADMSRNPYARMHSNQSSSLSTPAMQNQFSRNASGNQFQQSSLMVGYGAMSGMSEQLLADLEPTPLRVSPQNHVQQNHPNDSSQYQSISDSIFDEDPFSPTPIHQNYQQSRSHRPETAMMASQPQQYQPQGNNYPAFQGFNHQQQGYQGNRHGYNQPQQFFQGNQQGYNMQQQGSQGNRQGSNQQQSTQFFHHNK